MSEIRLIAKIENLSKVINFIKNQIEGYIYDKKSLLELELSIEEIFVNIVNYAYTDEKGEVVICSNIQPNPLIIKIQFIDWGVPYNPLEYNDPDLSLTLQDKEVGGLGIFLIKKYVESLDYKFRDGKNILTIMKKFKVPKS